MGAWLHNKPRPRHDPTCTFNYLTVNTTFIYYSKTNIVGLKDNFVHRLIFGASSAERAQLGDHEGAQLAPETTGSERGARSRARIEDAAG